MRRRRSRGNSIRPPPLVTPQVKYLPAESALKRSAPATGFGWER